MATSRYQSEDAIKKILACLIQNRLPLEDHILFLLVAAVNRAVHEQNGVDDAFCDQVASKLCELNNKGALGDLEFNHLAGLNGYFFLEHAAAILILKEGGICNSAALRALFGVEPENIARSMVLLHQAGLPDDKTLELIMRHARPASLAAPLTLLSESNALKPEYAALVFTQPEHVLYTIAAFERAKIHFNLQNDLLTKSSCLPEVLYFLASRPGTASEKTLLSQKNVSMVRGLKWDKEALKNLLDRLNWLFFIKNDYNQQSFESQCQYAMQKLPMPADSLHAPVCALDVIMMFKKKAQPEGGVSLSSVRHPGK